MLALVLSESFGALVKVFKYLTQSTKQSAGRQGRRPHVLFLNLGIGGCFTND